MRKEQEDFLAVILAMVCDELRNVKDQGITPNNLYKTLGIKESHINRIYFTAALETLNKGRYISYLEKEGQTRIFPSLKFRNAHF